MTDISSHLGLPYYQTKQNEFEVQHNEALLILDALVMLAVIDRDLSAPPASPAIGDRYLVKAPGSGDFAGKDGQIAQYDVGGWMFFSPQAGWTCYLQDEHVLLAWNGSAWVPAFDGAGITELQNLSLLGIGTGADAANPFAAKLNNALWVAKTAAEGGDGTLRYKLSKESEAATLSLLFQDNFSGRAEIGLSGDDDFHFKTSPDGSAWTDALVLDRNTGAARLNSGLFLSGDLAPPQITADQNDYDPAGLSSASVLRLSSDASRSITGLAGGSGGRLMAVVNAGANAIVLKDADPASSAANRFAFGADVTLAAQQSAVLWYDAADSRWKLLAGVQGAGGGGGEVTSTGISAAGNIPKFSDTSADVIEDSGIASADILVDADIGTAVQPYDAELAAIAALTSAADKGIYFTGSGAAATFDLTSYGRSLAAVADEAAFKALVNLEIGVDVQAPLPKSVMFIIDGGGSVITTGIKGDVEIPFACTVTEVALLADQAGSIVIDIWKDSYANYPPTAADSITASAKPTLSSASKSKDSTLSGWTTNIAAGDILRFNVDSAATVTRVTVTLKLSD